MTFHTLPSSSALTHSLLFHSLPEFRFQFSKLPKFIVIHNPLDNLRTLLLCERLPAQRSLETFHFQVFFWKAFGWLLNTLWSRISELKTKLWNIIYCYLKFQPIRAPLWFWSISPLLFRDITTPTGRQVSCNHLAYHCHHAPESHHVSLAAKIIIQ